MSALISIYFQDENKAEDDDEEVDETVLSKFAESMKGSVIPLLIQQFKTMDIPPMQEVNGKFGLI